MRAFLMLNGASLRLMMMERMRRFFVRSCGIQKRR
jgi:hypothetical protein